MLPAVASPARSSDLTWACACRTPFRSRSRRTPGRPRVRGPQDRAARERVLGCSRSPLPVVRENVISCLHDRVAREPTLGVVPLRRVVSQGAGREHIGRGVIVERGDRKSTRLNSSHTVISYAVFCLKKKKKKGLQAQKHMIWYDDDRKGHRQRSPN